MLDYVKPHKVVAEGEKESTRSSGGFEPTVEFLSKATHFEANKEGVLLPRLIV